MSEMVFQMSLQIIPSRLKRLILKKMDLYLQDPASTEGVSEWAVSILRDRSFTDDEALFEDALV
ncbi:MAG TPA: hypothetical protein VFT91_02665, partial [Dehalococcoidia bacterium]|nr:hypothetical protein [Dehalococcoidia bacterium]